jgi:hypothetical protein
MPASGVGHVTRFKVQKAFMDRYGTRQVGGAYHTEWWIPAEELEALNDHLTVEAWQADVAVSDVRMQWDPDHAPDGSKLERRAIQLGLRGAALKAMAGDELLEVIDVSPFITEQRRFIHSAAHYAELQTPVETVFEPRSPLARKRAWG